MKSFYYYRGIRKTIIMFLDMFNDISIARYASNDTTVRKYLSVPLKFAPKQKIWHWIFQRKDDEILPIMSAHLQSCALDTARIANKDARIVKTTSLSEKTVSRFLNPIPYNFNFQLSMWSLYMADIDQILEQILPFFDPYAMTQLTISELDTTIDIKVVLQSCSPDYNLQMADEDRRILMWNLEFGIQGYLFKPLSDTKMIEEIITNYYLNPTTFDNRDTSSTFTSGSPVSGADMTSWILGTGYDEDDEKLYNYEVFD